LSHSRPEDDNKKKRKKPAVDEGKGWKVVGERYRRLRKKKSIR